MGYNNFGGGAKAYGITEPDTDGVVLVVGGGISTPSPTFDTAWQASASGGLLNASPLPNSTKGTIAINDAGVIAYYGYSADRGANVGMVYFPGAGTVEAPYFRPTAVNNLGQVASYDEEFHGAVWKVAADGTLSDFVSLGNFRPFAINDWGEMAGQHGSVAAVAWFEDGMLQIADLPGLYAGNYGRATAINNFGEVVGVSATNVSNAAGSLSGYYRPFRWDTATGLTALTADVQGAALDINDQGQIVGWSTNSNYYAFLWENGRLSDLNALSGVGTKTFRLGSAEAINNAGQIAGRTDTWKGTNQVGSGTYLLTPKP